MKTQTKKEKMKSIITITIAIILLLLLIFAEDIVKLQNKNKIALLENSAEDKLSYEANHPILSAGMIPVKWDGMYWQITTQDDVTWYDYSTGKPAYMMLNDGVYQSELVRDMTNKKLAEESIGAQIQDSELGTIFIWIPRYAINNESNEIKYAPAEMQIARKWTIPDMFIYKRDNEKMPDFSLDGVWVQKNVDKSYSSKITEMSKEEGIYGFLANTIGIGVADEPESQIAIQQYIQEAGVANDSIEAPENTKRIILKIVKTNKIEPIKAKVLFNEEDMQMKVVATYSKNQIKQIEDLDGNIKSYNSTEAIDTNIPKNGIYKYLIIDVEGNEKQVEAEVNIEATITYNPNGGTVTPTDITCGYGEDIIMPIPELKYRVSYNTNGGTAISADMVVYDFKGWYTESDGGDKKEYTTMPRNNQILYAQWEATSINLPEAKKAGAKFEGWYEDVACTVKLGDAGDEFTTDKNVTIYAKWTEIAVYATLYTDGTLAFSSTNETISGKTVSASYGNINGKSYSSTTQPWRKNLATITSVDIIDTIQPSSTEYWFYNCTALETINNINNLNTSNVTNMYGMFWKCSSITSLDVSKFDTSNVTGMGYMFEGCSSLTSLDVSNFDTSNVTKINRMFKECSGLTGLDVSGFDTSNVTNMGYVFEGCSSLTSIDVSNFDTSNVTDMRYMFEGCSSLTSIDVSKFDTSNVTNMGDMFYGCSSVTELDVSNFDTSNVTGMSSMFRGCSSVTELDVSNFDTSNVTNMGDMFYGCSSVTELDVSNFDTSNVTGMSGMFKGCSSVTELDVSNFDTSNVTSIHSMFYECSSLTSLDVSNFDTSNVTSMYAMFYKCSNLTSLNVSNFDTSNVTDMGNMFEGCKNITSLDLSNFNTKKVTYMSWMFSNCSKLTVIYVGANWYKCTNSYYMFDGCGTSSVTKK